MKVKYHPKPKELSRRLRNNSTKSEIRLWQYLKSKKMMGYDFHRQKPVDSFILDFFCNKLKLAIELAGYTHTFEEIVEKDILKQERVKEFGIKVLRFCDEDVMKNMEGVLQTIKCFIEDYERQKKHPPRPLLIEGIVEGDTPPSLRLIEGKTRLDIVLLSGGGFSNGNVE
jgi:very-short-patch-repair endonuclease